MSIQVYKRKGELDDLKQLEKGDKIRDMLSILSKGWIVASIGLLLFPGIMCALGAFVFTFLIPIFPKICLSFILITALMGAIWFYLSSDTEYQARRKRRSDLGMRDVEKREVVAMFVAITFVLLLFFSMIGTGISADLTCSGVIFEPYRFFDAYDNYNNNTLIYQGIILEGFPQDKSNIIVGKVIDVQHINKKTKITFEDGFVFTADKTPLFFKWKQDEITYISYEAKNENINIREISYNRHKLDCKNLTAAIRPIQYHRQLPPPTNLIY